MADRRRTEIAAVARSLDAPSLGEQDEAADYHTIGGLAMAALGRIPRTGDVVERGDLRMEIVDMDGNRVDRLLVSRRH